LSAATRTRIQADLQRYDEFIKGFDPNYWTAGEKREFASTVGSAAALGLVDEVPNAYWQATAPGRALVTLDEAVSAEARGITANEYSHARVALEAQEKGTADLNAAAPVSRQDPVYADQFAVRSRVEGERMDQATLEAQRRHSDFMKAFERRDEHIATRTLVPLPPDAPPIVLPASAVAAPEKTAVDRARAEKAEHCSGGAFKCPNGNPWPKCRHIPEKYKCPPPEFAEDARRALNDGKAIPGR
jgi:hypothetical protein